VNKMRWKEFFRFSWGRSMAIIVILGLTVLSLYLGSGSGFLPIFMLYFYLPILVPLLLFLHWVGLINLDNLFWGAYFPVSANIIIYTLLVVYVYLVVCFVAWIVRFFRR